jgi:hypothetical protein
MMFLILQLWKSLTTQRQRDHRAVYDQGHKGKKNDLSCTDVVGHKLLLVDHL